MTCSCARLRVGFELTDQREWNPTCREHGVGSAWYLSPEQTAKRAQQNERTAALAALARRARAGETVTREEINAALEAKP